jgi:Tol biopolymer transport system component
VIKQLTDNDVQDGNPVWSSDGTQIAFYRATGDGYHIWVMNKDGTDPHDLMPDRPGRNLDPNWR